jgi:hypothetical protein
MAVDEQEAAEAVSQKGGDHIADQRVDGLGMQADRPGEAKVERQLMTVVRATSTPVWRLPTTGAGRA